MTPTPDLFQMAYRMLEEVWDRLRRLASANVVTTEKEIQQIERKTDQLMDRIVAADSPTLITAYENQIRKLEQTKLRLREEAARHARPLPDFGRTYRTAMEFLGNPWKLWESGGIEDKRLVLRLAFANKLSYVRNSGYRTRLSLPFQMLAAISPVGSGMVVVAV